MTGNEALERLARSYLDAKDVVIGAGYEHELTWQQEAADVPVEESDLLAEAAWVILNSGMRESVIRPLFARIAVTFCDFESCERIISMESGCRDSALAVFRHPRKIDAILAFVRATSRIGAPEMLRRIRYEGPESLYALPFFGPATARHLAKNIGVEVAKPDRHLRRLADWLGFGDPQQLCHQLADVTGDSVAVVDVVLWRYSTLVADPLTGFTPHRAA